MYSLTQIFGGIVVLNREVDAATAQKVHGVFLEIIIAPKSYTDEALEILTTKKKNLRILELPFDAQDASEVGLRILVLLVSAHCVQKPRRGEAKVS